MIAALALLSRLGGVRRSGVDSSYPSAGFAASGCDGIGSSRGTRGFPQPADQEGLGAGHG